MLDFTLDLKIMYFYERNFFAIFFAIFITTITNTKGFSIFKALPESKLFLLFGRINLAYICIIESIVEIFFTVYDIELYFSYQNIFFITLGLYVFTFMLSFVFVYLFELPVRKIIKIFFLKKNYEGLD